MSSTWAEQPLEHLLQERLNTLPGTAGADLFGDYTSARKFVLEEIVEHIDRAEPNLTDHGPRHLADVMGRAHQLLSLGKDDLTPDELYVLCVSILFHDVGNLHGRAEHHKKIGGVYAQLRGQDSRFLSERNAVLAVAGAHTGTTKDGNKDTLRNLDRRTFRGTSVRIREIAALLRLSDELAEGRHRTSAYLTNIGGYSIDSAIYHAYAEIVEYAVHAADPGRIAMTFTLDIVRKNQALTVHGVELTALLNLCYKRIIKLDQERRFCKYYCPFLRELAETGAWFNFYFEGQPLELDLHPLVVSDLVVPGDITKEVKTLDADYDLTKLIPRLSALCSGGSQQ
jgi:hypothetical protein